MAGRFAHAQEFPMDVTLLAETGRPAGSRSTNRLRREGKIPGVVYGLDSEPVAITVPWTDLRRALTTEAGANALVTLEYDGNKDLTIVKDLQRDPVRRDILHVDFLRVDPNRTVAVEVPIVIVGEAKEVENNRGIAEQSMKSITVHTKPADIPYDPSKPLPPLGQPGKPFLAGMADGIVKVLPRTVSEKTFRLAICPADGNVLGPDWPQK